MVSVECSVVDPQVNFSDADSDPALALISALDFNPDPACS
jgi:hypothetical protein